MTEDTPARIARDKVRHAFRIAGLAALRDPGAARAFVEDILEAIQTDFPEPQAQNTALAAADRCLRAHSRVFDLPLPLPRRERIPAPPDPLRDAAWPVDAAWVLRLDAALGAKLTGRRFSALDLGTMILASLILRGGLLRPAGWVAVWTLLAERRVQLCAARSLPDLPWIDLLLPPTPGRAGNLPRGTQGELLRIYPDVVTLALLDRWQRTTGDLPRITTHLGILTQLRAVLLPGDPTLPPNPDRFAEAAFLPLEDRLPHPVPQVLFAAAAGTVPAFSAPTEVWTAFWTGRREKIAPPVRRRHPIPARHPTAPATPEQSRRTLGLALQKTAAGADKQRPAPVRAALLDALDTPLVPTARALALWFVDLLGKGRAVSTARRYFSAIGTPLLALTGTADPADFTAGELEALCALAVKAMAPETAAYATGRLAQLCDFAFSDPRLAWPDVEIEGGPGRHRRVRVGLVSPHDCHRAIETFNTGDARLHRRTLPFAAAFALGYRGGLRLSDMEALLVRDVSEDWETSLAIHHTRFGDLKSDAGRRKIPLGLLARPHELASVRAHRDLRKRDPDGAFLATGATLFDPAFERRDFAAALGEATGLTPHDLRHAALSNLALATLAPPGSSRPVEILTGWSANRQKRLRTIVTGNDSRRTLPQIARLAGHAHPATTFVSYLHLCDLALGLHVRADRDIRERDDAARILGLNAATLPPEAGPVALEQLRPLVLPRLPLHWVGAADTTDMPSAPDLHLSPLQRVTGIARVLSDGAALDAIAQEFRVGKAEAAAITALLPRNASGRIRFDPPRRDAEQILAQTIIGALIAQPAPVRDRWLEETLRFPQKGPSFNHPENARRWLAVLPATIRYSAVLNAASGEDPARWQAFRPAVSKSGPRTRLTLDLLADGKPARAALPFAALILRMIIVMQGAGEAGPA
ncbi:MAG TPA: hypothetical protein VGC40_12730 [Paenirhodobacter sp.]